MKKIIKKEMAILMVFVFTVISNIVVLADSSDTNADVSGGQIIQTYIRENKRGEDSGNDVMGNEEESNQIYSKMMSNMEDAEEYPDCYAGAYIDDAGELVVLVTDLSSETEKEIEKIAENDDFKLETVDVSYNDLLEIQAYITDYYENNYQNSAIEGVNELLDSYVEIWIDDMENRVVVNIEDLTDEKVATFKEYITDDENVVLENSDTIEYDATAWKLGRAIYRYKSTSGSTVYSSKYSTGFRCKYLVSSGIYYYGFVTSAHGGNTVGKVIYANGACSTSLGKIVARKYSGSVDAAFVRLTNSNYSISNQVLYKNSSGDTGGKTLNTSYHMEYATVGSTIYKSGAATYLTSGEVISSSCSITVDGTTFTHIIKTDYKSAGGDSGGVVYVKYNDKYWAVGIHESHSNNYSYAVSAKYIVSGLGVSVY